MPMTPHIERHFIATATVRDIVIGMADRLTVPFALAAGLSGVVASSGIVVTAGLAEIAAASIAMGLGGYLAAGTDGTITTLSEGESDTRLSNIPAEKRMKWTAFGVAMGSAMSILSLWS